MYYQDWEWVGKIYIKTKQNSKKNNYKGKRSEAIIVLSKKRDNNHLFLQTNRGNTKYT